MAVTTTKTNKPINPRGDDKSPLAFNRAKIYSGKALDFDGVNDQITTNQDLGNLQTLSVAMHCRIDNMTDGTARGVISQWDGSDGWMIYKSSGTSYLTFWKNGSQNINWTESTNYSDQWIHLVYVIEQGVGSYVYANGVLVGSDTTNTENIDYTKNPTLKVGVYGNTPSGYFNGAVNGVKVYSTALTAAQILELYNNPEKIVPTGVSNDALKLWLPMMEGAGTTAYDGSGNGNHGTISGATWMQGVGAPVAQTAVIDWNKGTNLLLQSNQFDTTWTGNTSNRSITSGFSGYDGTNNAWKLEAISDNNYSVVNQLVSSTGVETFSVYAKAGTSNFFRIQITGGTNTSAAYFDLSGSGSVGLNFNNIDAKIEPVGNGWFRCSVTGNKTTSSNCVIFVVDANSSTNVTTGANVYIQDAQLESASTAGAYVLTLSSAQSSEVLIPQSLTSGRDLFYNSFENVRKRYALNLDGQSWAEIHDNESLDFGTGSFSLEAWVKAAYIDTGSSYNVILNLGNTLGGSAGLTSRSGYIAFFYGTSSLNYSTSNDGSWVHIVGTYDGTNTTIYANGVEESQTARTAINVSTDETKYIGKDSNITRIYKDQIAQPRIYNRALTADEVEQNYNAGKNTYS